MHSHNGDRVLHLIDTLSENYCMGDLTKDEEDFFVNIEARFDHYGVLPDPQVRRMEEILEGILRRGGR